MLKWTLVGAFAAGLFGCSDDASPGGDRTTYTKAQAEALGGETAEGRDICSLMGWYTDGICDSFCVQADEECRSGTCVANSDCRNGEECDEGQCVAIIPGCSATLPCPSNLYCEFGQAQGCGLEAQPGQCLAAPETCTKDLALVCGCDGATYTNACEAARAQVSVASEGECEPAAHGGCQTSQECAESLFCFRPVDDQCSAETPGTCQEVPETCTRDLMPVCGCDEVTYSNACEAARASVSVVAEGACPAEGACGGRLGDSCAETEYCLYETDAMCGRADMFGLCTVLPEACPKNYVPVCGCDGKTYGNSCLAALQGVSVDYDGACSCQGNVDCADGETCASGFCAETLVLCGSAADTCALTQWCDFGGTTGVCGQMDLSGTCQDRPTTCPAVISPVCGCDGNTYNNACEAHVAGVDILHTRACRIRI